MQRGAQSARRHFGGVVLPTYVFQYIRLRRFYRVACLALWCFIFQYAARSFFHFLASPWVAFWLVGPGWALEVLGVPSEPADF